MTARVAAWLCVMGMALPLAAQTTSEESAPSTQPASTVWTGVLTGTNVYVRSGAGQQAYACTRLSKPDRVVVIGRTDGWLRILAPRGCFSVIGKDYVQLDESGTTGTVTGDNVWVRAGGDLRDSDFIGVQRQLSRGDRVEVLGEVGNYYKITPPAGAYFYISEHYVRPAEGAPAEATTAPAEPLTAMVEPGPPAAGARPQPTQAEKLAAFKMAEKVLTEEFAKPLEQRDLKKALAMYNAIPVGPDDPLKPYVDARVTFIRESMRDIIALERVKELAKTTAERQAEYEALRERLQKVTPPAQPPRFPAATGVLQPSMVFPGTAAIGKRYILINPETHRTTAYVQATGERIDLTKYVGINVAVYGPMTFDTSLQRYVVDPEDIEIVGQGGLIGPPEPTVRVPPVATAPAVIVPPPPLSRPAPASRPVPPPRFVTPRPPVPVVRPVTSQPTTQETQPAVEEAPHRTTTAPARGLPVVTDRSTSEPINEEEYE
jgi:hypothetical protein